MLERLRSGAIRRVIAIGQGTAAIAAAELRAGAATRARATPTSWSKAKTATELSGFGLDADMHDTLVVAISQSGTTTDTNRTVDLARSRGALVLAIVNRRQSDLVDKSDGVLYTSDGRDIEMSVASTKAWYAQVAAGFLLAYALAPELGADRRRRPRAIAHERLVALRDAARRDGGALGPPARDRRRSRSATRCRAASWAVVGNGNNRVAALEVRIKLSELCYKSIACDVIEDKKHIDLSAEPMIIVCAAGLRGSNADDVAKELAIYRAHKAVPIAIVDDDEDRYRAAVDTISVPRVHPDLAFVLCAMAGHLFGYEAALAIDASARPLREARGCIEPALAAAGDDDPLASLAIALEPRVSQFFDTLRTGGYDGCLDAGDRGALGVGAALRDRRGAARLVRNRAREGRDAEHRHRGPDRRAHEGDRGADAADRRDQAPGEDGHGRNLALRRDAAASSARPGGARQRHAARQPHLPRAANARRARSRGRWRSSAGRATASPATRFT